MRTVELTHYLDLVDDRLFAVVFGVSGLFAKGLNCHVLPVLDLLSHVDRSEISLADLLIDSKHMMELPLIDSGRKKVSPLLDLFHRGSHSIAGHLVSHFAHESKANNRAKGVIFFVFFWNGLTQNLKLRVEIQFKVLARLPILFLELRGELPYKATHKNHKAQEPETCCFSV